MMAVAFPIKYWSFWTSCSVVGGGAVGQVGGDVGVVGVVRVVWVVLVVVRVVGVGKSVGRVGIGNKVGNPNWASAT